MKWRMRLYEQLGIANLVSLGLNQGSRGKDCNGVAQRSLHRDA